MDRRPSLAKPQTVVVPRMWHGQTLQLFLADRLKLSKRQAKSMIDARVVWVNRKLTWMAQHNLSAGDQVTFSVTPGTGAKDKQDRPAEKSHIRILWQDDYYIFADKPAGMLTQGNDSLESRLQVQEANPSIAAVHRLDRDTSGILLIAKNKEARDAAVAIFKTRRVKKVYQAICLGQVEQHVSTVNDELDGEKAITHFSRMQSNRDVTFLKLRIETGRTHQIRRHLSSIRHPILGDNQYGMKKTFDPRIQSVTRQMLHALEIELPHPIIMGQSIKAHSPLPADFRAALKLFGLTKRR